MEAICKADYDKRVKSKKDFEKEAKRNSSAAAPLVGFHDIYGVWFFGNLCAVIRQVHVSRFGINQQNMMHVFVDEQPGNIPDGIHSLTVYDHGCRLFKWKAQGYHRGLVALADDMRACAVAQVYLESGTWSWKLSAGDNARLAELGEEYVK